MAEPSYHEAMKDVRARVARAKTSFAAGMGMLPLPRREAMYALYAFCREVDDIADDSPTPEARTQGLSLWRKRIKALFEDGRAEDSLTAALKPAVGRFSLVQADFQDIIDGMEMDANAAIVAPPMDELDLYCDKVASAVGRASVRIFGDDSAAALRVAHHLGRALQLTNILRDLSEDAARGRLYLPTELLGKHGVSLSAPEQVLAHPSLPLVCRDLAEIAEIHFRQAQAAMREANWHAMRAARAMGRYYHALLKRLRQSDWRDPAVRVRLSWPEKKWIAFCGLVD